MGSPVDSFKPYSENIMPSKTSQPPLYESSTLGSTQVQPPSTFADILPDPRCFPGAVLSMEETVEQLTSSLAYRSIKPSPQVPKRRNRLAALNLVVCKRAKFGLEESLALDSSAGKSSIVFKKSLSPVKPRKVTLKFENSFRGFSSRMQISSLKQESVHPTSPISSQQMLLPDFDRGHLTDLTGFNSAIASDSQHFCDIQRKESTMNFSESEVGSQNYSSFQTSTLPLMPDELPKEEEISFDLSTAFKLQKPRFICPENM